MTRTHSATIHTAGTSSLPSISSRRPRSAGRFAARDHRAERLLVALSTSRDEVERERLTEELVTLHLELCDGLAARYSGRSISTEDLVQVARLALLVAIRRYRPAPGSSFIGYALPTISGELKRHFRDHGWMVRPPRRLQELGPVVRQARERWQHYHGAAPTIEDLAGETGVARDEIAECLSAEQGYHPLSLDLTFGDDESRALSDHLAEPQSELESAVDRVCLTTALRRLPVRDRELVQMRFVDGLTQKEIGQTLGVSQMQVSRLVRGVLERLRTQLGGSVEGERSMDVA